MTPQQVRRLFRKHKIDKIKLGTFDVDGVLRGKYVSLEKFFAAVESGFGFCDVIFGWDSSDALYDNVSVTGWHTGYPDLSARIDLSTFRLLPWEPQTAFFLADVFNADGSPFILSPRQLLRSVVARAESAGYFPKAAFEYEYFFFREDPQSARDKHFRGLVPLSPGMFGYSVLRASVHSGLAHAILDATRTMDLELEGFHTETGPGVYETAIRYDTPLGAADKAALFKTAVKVVAQRQGLMATFMAKWSPNFPGCSGHLHQSLSNRQGKNLFSGRKSEAYVSETMRRYMAGQLSLMREFTVIFCPTINSYKRTVPGTWAPTNLTWGMDNRTTALRAIPSAGSGSRVESRLPGADANPYLVLSAALGSGLRGIERKSELPPATANAYASNAPALPRNLEEATELFRHSEAAEAIFGKTFVEHFSATRDWEARQFRRAVTDWELERYFEII